ncbi:MAG: phosphoribosylformylglycinamidine cyclo-ligase [Acidobacteriia bacterium]|nr:phosphoribosylformylglycinamidine cyclo-ligase [Terriglobia bacterium]
MVDSTRDRRLTYESAGVSIDAQDRALVEVRRLAKTTFTTGVLSEIGSFGGLFTLEPDNPSGTVLVASADGVGTKLKVAQTAARHGTVGEDLVNHCVNDILVLGARPLFFLDYFASGRLEPGVAVAVIEGLTRGCRANGCALLGGETAEMPGFYQPGEYDLAGFIVGSCVRDRLLRVETVRTGDALVALPSTGLHTNGYSLARKVLIELLGLKVTDEVPALGRSVADALLAVHRSYLPALGPLLDAGFVKSAAHITGGGIPDNLPRALPSGVGAEIDLGSWDEPALFRLIREAGRVPEDDMRRTFNLGVGMILVVAEASVPEVLEGVSQHPGGWLIGRTVAGKGVRFVGERRA